MADSTVDFRGGWTDLWTPVNDALGTGGTTLLAVIGTAMVVGGLATFVWEKRKGQGNSSKLMYIILFGALLNAPNLIIPAMLWLVDLLINGVVGIFTSNTG